MHVRCSFFDTHKDGGPAAVLFPNFMLKQIS